MHQIPPDIDTYLDCKSTGADDFLVSYVGMEPSQIEHMLFAVIDCSVHGQQRLEYLICVNYIAYMILNALDPSKTRYVTVRGHQQKLRQQYCNNVLFCLQHLDLSVKSEVVFLQALSFATHLMRELGHHQKCWELNGVAGEVCSRLAESQSMASAVPPDAMLQIHLIFMRCYVYDRALALSEQVTPSRPRFQIQMDRTALLSSSSETDTVINIMFDLASAQETLLADMDGSQLPTLSSRRRIDCMHEIRDKMNSCMARQLSAQDPYWSFAWLSLDLLYYSTMAMVIRSISRGEDTIAYLSCLESVREALDALISMLEHAIMVDSSGRRCIGTMAW